MQGDAHPSSHSTRITPRAEQIAGLESGRDSLATSLQTQLLSALGLEHNSSGPMDAPQQTSALPRRAEEFLHTMSLIPPVWGNVGLCPELRLLSMRAHAPYPERLSRNSHHILFFTPMITKGDWKEGKKKGEGEIALSNIPRRGFFFFLSAAFVEEPTAEGCHPEPGVCVTLPSPPRTRCVFAAVLITLTCVFINILNWCRKQR